MFPIQEMLRDLSNSLITVEFNPLSDQEARSIPQRIYQENSFLAVPSADQYYLGITGQPIPKLSSPDSPHYQRDVNIWYSLNQDLVFPLKTSYAQARSDQMNLDPVQDYRRFPPSELSYSLKSGLRQYPDENSQLSDDYLEFLTNQTRDITVGQLLRDIYRYPVNPIIDIFRVARLIGDYLEDGHEDSLRRYLADLGITSLDDHSFDYYPIYELFFLLTRLYSYPLTEEQIALAERRNQTQPDSPERMFIDSIFHLYIYDLDSTLGMIDQISQDGPESVGLSLGTPFPDWVKWANEYLELVNQPELPVEYVGAPVNQTAPKFYTWTDLSLSNLMTELELTLPDRNQCLNRYDWVENIASIIKRYRSNAASNDQYGLRK